MKMFISIFILLASSFAFTSFNISTFRSTKKMQVLQPKIQALREKFKNDPQGMNQAQMQLWKENKVNPLGGCFQCFYNSQYFLH